MRSIEKIKEEISEIKARLSEGYTNTDLCELEYELRQVLIYNIPLDRLEEICKAEADGRLIIKHDNEVYKCKNCKHLLPSEITNRLYCSYHGEGDNQYETYKDDYCSYFELLKQN